jgi:serine/threonine protein kinase
MINEVNIKQKPLNEWFKSSVPQDALDLLTSMLSINPHKRPTAAQVLKHPYLASFHKPKEEMVSDKVIHPPISDNTKLNLKEYRKLIYERIKKLYSFEKDVPKSVNTVPVEPAQDIRKSVERSVGRPQHPNQNVEKRSVSSK